MFIIEEGSEAYATLKSMIERDDTRKISIAVHEIPDADEVKVCLKRNENMWTYPLHANRRPDLPHDPAPDRQERYIGPEAAFALADREIPENLK